MRTASDHVTREYICMRVIEKRKRERERESISVSHTDGACTTSYYSHWTAHFGNFDLIQLLLFVCIHITSYNYISQSRFVLSLRSVFIFLTFIIRRYSLLLRKRESVWLLVLIKDGDVARVIPLHRTDYRGSSKVVLSCLFELHNH